MPFALLSIQIKPAVLMGQRQPKHCSLVGASSWVHLPPGSPTAWSPAQDVERWVPAPVRVCFPPESALHLAPPMVYFVYSTAAQLAFIMLACSCSWRGIWTGVGGLEVSEVRDSPSCLLTAQSASSRPDLMVCIPISMGVGECFNCVQLCATHGW